MHLLLIAYEFPPIESAQGLRWGYLARELARRGHSIDVVTADLGLPTSATFAHPALSVQPVFPGPFVGASRWIATHQRLGLGENAEPTHAAAQAAGIAERAYRGARAVLDRILVPDVRSEWRPWGLNAARRLVRDRRPDLILASHEPGVDLSIACALSRLSGVPAVADLGDPLLASYAPRWRRRIDARAEKRWLAAMRALTVTTDATRDLLRTRAAVATDIPIEVLPQGFDPDPDSRAVDGLFDAQRFELLYTGTLYAEFRDPQPLLDALSTVPSARLTVLGGLHGIEPQRLAANPQVRFLGRRSHAFVSSAQRAADVLVNIGNREDVQVPGKLFEYFGAARPILHLAQTATDPSAKLLRSLRRGIAVAARADDIGVALRHLAEERDRGFDLSFAPVADYGWPRLAERLEAVLLSVLAPARAIPGASPLVDRD